MLGTNTITYVGLILGIERLIVLRENWKWKRKISITQNVYSLLWGFFSKMVIITVINYLSLSFFNGPKTSRFYYYWLFLIKFSL